ncbi:hypothetical protein Acr_28g0013820 [Actinidia rufa]|uniref:Uncharacterized protein n=1 Tax=Actinidia rufa TaxID=165716 RepID=A0A7J0HC26_9ERIC|nr:hypothetical protein Acr_28g0013820 [Actinidia rufa]
MRSHLLGNFLNLLVLLLRVVKEVDECIKLLKNAAKTRRIAAKEVLSALAVIEKAKLDPSRFLETLGGLRSPGRTWMLIFTAKNDLKSGTYFPITAVQRFDATAKRIENGVYLGPLGRLTFEGRFSWKKRILAFIFERMRIKIGPFYPFEIQFGGKDETEPSTKNPFFIWFYIDDEIAVARGKSGGTAFWCRCRQVSSFLMSSKAVYLCRFFKGNVDFLNISKRILNSNVRRSSLPFATLLVLAAELISRSYSLK